MKRSTICSRVTILSLLMLLSLGEVAQQAPTAAVKPDLALEINNGDNRPWMMLVFGVGGGQLSSFTRIESWKPASGEAPVDSIGFKIEREAGILVAHLSVKLENEKEVFIATYRLKEDETIRTEELTKFGVEPLTLKVIRAKPPIKDPLAPIMPKVENRTKAIEVASFAQSQFSADSFQLSLRNVSNKTIIALDLFMPSADGNGGAGQRSQGVPGHPVMVAGGTSVYHFGVSHGGRMTDAGYVPDLVAQQTLIIRTVVFDDGSYEGLVQPAAEIEAQRRGLEIQRRKVLRLLQETTEPADANAHITAGELKEQAYALGKTADTSVSLEVMALFPSLDEKAKALVSDSIGDGLRDGKLEFLHYLDDFEQLQKQPGEHISFANWVKETTAKYEKMTMP